MSDVIRLYANETRGSRIGSKVRCRYCRQPIVWMTTARNRKPIAMNGHEPAPLRTEREAGTGATIEIHDRAAVHFETCEKRPVRN